MLVQRCAMARIAWEEFVVVVRRTRPRFPLPRDKSFIFLRVEVPNKDEVDYTCIAPVFFFGCP